MLVELLGCPRLADATATDDGHEVGHGQGLVLIVGHQKRRGPRLAQHALHVGADRSPEPGVQRGEGFIEKDHLGLDGQGAVPPLVT